MPRRPARPGTVLALLATASFLASLDVFIVNVALRDIGADIGRGHALSDLSWVLNAYAIVFAALLVPAGRLADRFGQKGGFLLGLGVFVVASLGAALSGDLWVLVGFRTVQAAGAALLTPASLGLLIASTPVERRARAVRTWAATGALAAAAGPVVGGLLLTLSWHWIFLVNLPIGGAAMALGQALLPQAERATDRRLPDLAGGAVLLVGVGGLALGLVKAPEWGWDSARTLCTWVVAALAAAVFVRRSHRHPVPVVELSLLRIPSFARANVVGVLFSIAFAAQLLATVLWLQEGWGWSALRSGLAIAPGPLMVPVFAEVGQRLSARLSAGTLIGIGCGLFGLGALLMLLSVGPGASYATTVLPGWLVAGVGVGLTLPTILSSATRDLPLTSASTGSAVVTTARQLGMVLGVSVLVAVVGAPASAADLLDRLRIGWGVVAGASALAAAAALAGRRQVGRPGRSSADPAYAGGSVGARTPAVVAVSQTPAPTSRPALDQPQT